MTLRTSSHVATNLEEHPEQSNIEIRSPQVDLAAEAGISETSSKLPCSILGVFRAKYFRLFSQLDTRGDRLILLLAVILALAAGVPLPIIGVIFGKIINGFPPTENQLTIRLAELMGVAVAYFLITWGWATCWGIIGEKSSRNFRERVFQKVIGMDIAYFEVGCPDISQRLTADVQAVQLGISEKCGLFLQSVGYFIAAFITGFVLNARLTSILFAAVITPMAFVVMYGSKMVSKLAKLAAVENARATIVIEGAIRAVAVVQAFGAAEILARRHHQLMVPVLKTGVKKAIWGATLLGLVYFIAYAANALAFWEGSRLIASASLDPNQGVGTIYTVTFLVLDASFVIGQCGPFFQTFILAVAAGDRILAVLDHPEPAINIYSEDGVAMPPVDERLHITLKGVSFAYPSRPTVKVSRNLNMSFKAGTVNAIVGRSGSGKSTLAALLLRFYDPISGSIQIGEIDLKNINLENYRSHVALVDQDCILFSGTILDNIRCGMTHTRNLSENEIVQRCHQAARDADAYNFISRLPMGFNTKIGETGTTQLSGGQRQKIALARAIIKNPTILILDEPTSGLDSLSEALVLNTIQNTAKFRTTIIITHRCISRVDRIFVMDNGTVVDEGTHEILMSRDGPYLALVQAQNLSNSYSTVISNKDHPTGEAEDAWKDARALGDFQFLREESTSIVLAEEDNAPSPYGSLIILRRCLAISKPDMLFILVGLLASCINGGIITGESLILGNMISVLNDKSNPERLKSRTGFLSLMFFVLSLVALIAYTLSGSLFGLVSERLIHRLQNISLRTILRQDIEWFNSPNRSVCHLVSMINSDTAHLSALSGVILGTIVTVVISMSCGIIMALFVAWKVAIVILGTIPLIIFSGFLRIRIFSKFEQRRETAYIEAAAIATEACNAIKVVAAFSREKDICKLYHAAIDGPYRHSLKFIVTSNILLAFALTVPYFVYALAYWWGAKQTREGSCTSLQFFIVLPALLFSAQASGQMFSLAPEVTQAKIAAQSIFALHDQKPTINTEINSRFSGSAPKPSSCGGKVEFHDVKFHYASRLDSPVLRGISLTIQRGQFVAFVGPSGAGKSSAIALLMRLYDPTSGRIHVDDESIARLSVEDHRKRISLVSQEPCLFPGSISFNIGLGIGEECTQQDVMRVCKMCGIHDFIMSLPDGYETECGLNGSRLSGGQKQRIALARALIRDPSILLLDEATSALDPHAEKLVKQAIKSASKGRTCIAVTHKIASIQNADCIYVFWDGNIVESGKHEELLALDGVYKTMVYQQFCK